MMGSLVIVFREVLEAALVVTILLVATRGLAGRNQWIGGGVGAGIVGALIVAYFAGNIAGALAGVGQEVFNAGVLFLAVLMLAWHNIWMSSHGREMAANLKQVGSKVSAGNLPFYFLATAAGLAVLREGSEIVLFLYGISVSGGNAAQLTLGGVLGLTGGVAVGACLYFGLVGIPMSALFRITGILILLLAAGMAATAAGFLSQAGLLPGQQPLWDTSAFLSEHSLVGQLLHILVGYHASPTLVQLGFYCATLALIGGGMYFISRQKPAVSSMAA